MKILNYSSVEPKDAGEGTSKVTIRWLIDKKTGAKNFFMRLFEIEAGGYTPLHQHDWEHEVFILEGEGVIVYEEETKLFRAGDVIFIPPNEKHQFRNSGKKLVKLLCLIPNKKNKEAVISCGCRQKDCQSCK
jgi:quercetin dioxygenase-like cupin family protein